jgi:hypothetical protein
MTDAQQGPYAPGQYPGGANPSGPYPGGTYPGGPYPDGTYPDGQGQPGYGPYPPPPYGYGGYNGYGYPAQPGTNTMAILALVFAFIFAPVAIVLGVLARKQIRRTGEQGMGLATAGMVCGIVFTVLSVVWIVVVSVFVVSATHRLNQDDGGAALYAARAYLGF